MPDAIITDDEKDALLDGLSTGEVEVHSNNGLSYAAVTPFELGQRSRIRTNSYPRLQSLNRQFAGRVDKPFEQLLNSASNVEFDRVSTMTFGEFAEQSSELSLLIEFSPKPLHGSALIRIDATAVELLVETFYGGDSDDLTRKPAEFFTPGETSVAMRFADAVMKITSEVWKPLDDFSFEVVGTHLSSGVIDCIDNSDTVITSAFALHVGEKEHSFSIAWPVSTVSQLLPVFEGQKRERDAEQDARWESALRASLVESVIRVSSGVGHITMPLADIVDLSPGAVISISNPQLSTMFAARVPILQGRFGVHDGRYAIEAQGWIFAERASAARNQ